MGGLSGSEISGSGPGFVGEPPFSTRSGGSTTSATGTNNDISVIYNIYILPLDSWISLIYVSPRMIFSNILHSTPSIFTLIFNSFAID